MIARRARIWGLESKAFKLQTGDLRFSRRESLREFRREFLREFLSSSKVQRQTVNGGSNKSNRFDSRSSIESKLIRGSDEPWTILERPTMRWYANPVNLVNYSFALFHSLQSKRTNKIEKKEISFFLGEKYDSFQGKNGGAVERKMKWENGKKVNRII